MLQPKAQALPGTLDLLEMHRKYPERYPFLLESTTGTSVRGGVNSRYDVLLAHPSASLWLDDAGLHGEGFVPHGRDFLANLDRWHAMEAVTAPEQPDESTPFAGGWFLFLGYELAGQIEPVLRLPKAPAALPTALAVRCAAALVRDHATGQTLVKVEGSDENSYRQILEDIQSCNASSTIGKPEDAQHWALEISEEDPERFLVAVTAIQEYIRAGDVFQVNLSRLWNIRLRPDVDSVHLYNRLRKTNPAPFSGLMRWHNSALASSSPERLIHVDGRRVQTRPIAGTRPRLGGKDADRFESELLLQHPKERAEHIMLIDLERNDLGRICEPGSVCVDEFMTVESYAHVHHIVSNVSGKLRAGVGPGGIIRAIFPGGTITGCPKVRCMEVIAELEGQGRGGYTGSMGYLGRDGRMNLNILIRSLTWQPGAASLRAGSGIVVDSIPERELDETRAKARGLLKVFGQAS